jgi:hypothetical protein
MCRAAENGACQEQERQQRQAPGEVRDQANADDEREMVDADDRMPEAREQALPRCRRQLASHDMMGRCGRRDAEHDNDCGSNRDDDSEARCHALPPTALGRLSCPHAGAHGDHVSAVSAARAPR